MSYQDENQSVIKDLNLTTIQVLEIVREWYLEIPDDFLNQYAEELDEYVESILDELIENQ